MLKSYRAWLISLSLLFVVVLSGCANANASANAAPIDATSPGFWNHYIVYPISVMLQFVAHHLPNHSFGIAIIIITIVVRTILLPLTITQYRSQLKTKKMQPELQKLKEKYGDTTKNPEKQKQYQQEMMILMRTNGVNPVMGCLPLLLQMPVFSALYYAISHTEEIRSASFLWVNLGHADPYHILPALAAMATFLQMKILQSNMTGEQSQALKIQQFMMPAMILFMGFAAPSGLVLYWITSNLFTVVQTVLLKKVMDREGGQLQEA
ncbi:protein translocase subunit yidC [Bacillus sp. 491mf]|uniref:membrane protein insertase YidC n=1 Tax=Bacillus TaxID=1386 RepID=UPI00054ED248|nr:MULTISPECIES: membrane protein insertase YidC [unclassified Bacillus (in: firmicutes)]SFD23571.1 protein translocase subunit yidC [Bacillus sp. 491mf]